MAGCFVYIVYLSVVTLVLPWVSVQSTPSTSPATAASIHATTITDIPPTVSSEELGQSHLTTLQQQSTTGAVVSGKAVTISSQSKTPIVVSNSSPTLNASTAAKTTINRTTILPTTRKPINHTREVCYDTIGCFNNRPPYISSLPWSPQKIDVHFLLYTREWPSGNETVRIVYNDTESLRNSNFSTTRPTKFVVHGFLNDMKSPWPYVMKDELLKKADVNVILVFWGKGANVGITMYDQAATNTRVVAAEIKVLVLKMVSLGSDVSQVHLIGHSLGAHTSGYVGSRLKSDDNLVLGRITGLDPAEPDFEKQPMLVRLDKNDATYVDVIHTNGAPMLGGGGFGLMIQCGDVDFYVNGGELQPDCPNQITGIFTSGMAAGDVVACSHSRAHDIFTETINAQMCQFVGYPCASYDRFQRGECLECGEDGCAVMGYASDMYTVPRGKKFLNTRRSTPFCGHQYKVLVGVSHSGKTTKGKLEIQLAGTWATSEWFPATAAGKDDEQLKIGATVSHLAVAKEIVGRIMSISVRYTKYKGTFFGLFGGGQDTIQLQKVMTESGDNGEVTVFCLSDVALQTGVPKSFPAHSGMTCS